MLLPTQFDEWTIQNDLEWSVVVRYVTLVRFNEWNQYINKKINNFASLWSDDYPTSC